MTRPVTAPPLTTPAPLDREILVEQVVAAVLASPGVAALSDGEFGTVATLLPGRRIPGIVLGDDGVAVHLVTRYPAPVATVSAQVRAAVTRIVPGPVHVTVDDVVA